MRRHPHAPRPHRYTAHVLVDEAVTREALYIATTRARHHTQLYVKDETLLGLDAERPPEPQVDAWERLADVLAREDSEVSATEIRRRAPAAGLSEQRCKWLDTPTGWLARRSH
jgi:hypothetical protein